jgi:hypothetical protein
MWEKIKACLNWLLGLKSPETPGKGEITREMLDAAAQRADAAEQRAAELAGRLDKILSDCTQKEKLLQAIRQVVNRYYA